MEDLEITPEVWLECVKEKTQILPIIEKMFGENLVNVQPAYYIYGVRKDEHNKCLLVNRLGVILGEEIECVMGFESLQDLKRWATKADLEEWDNNFRKALIKRLKEKEDAL